MPPKSDRIHLLFKCTWNILQGGSHLESKIKALVNLRTLKSHQSSFPTTILWDYKSTQAKNLKNYIKKNINKWRLNNTLLNNHEITEEIRVNQKNTQKQITKHDDPEPVGHSKSSSKKQVYSNSILPKETRKISNKQSSHTPKPNRERTKKKLLEGKNSYDQSRNKWNRNEENNRKDQ